MLTDGSVKLSVVLRKSGQELQDPRQQAQIMWKWDLRSGESILLLVLRSYSV